LIDQEVTIVALTFRYGSLAEQVELCGIDTKYRPVKLGEGLGEKIEWAISSAGEGIMAVYSKFEDRIMQICYQWDKKSLSLKEARCK